MGWCCCCSLSLEETLDLAGQQMASIDVAKTPKDKNKLCSKVQKSLLEAEKLFEKENPGLPLKYTPIAKAYHDYAGVLLKLDLGDSAEENHKQAEKWGYVHLDNKISEALPICPIPSPEKAPLGNGIKPSDSGHYLADGNRPVKKSGNKIFPSDVPPPGSEFELPETDMALTSTVQLAYSLSLLDSGLPLDSRRAEDESDWIAEKAREPHEVSRLRTLAIDIVRAFIRDELKSKEAVEEVVCLAPNLTVEDFQRLLMKFVDGIRDSTLKDVNLLRGLAKLLRNSPLDQFDKDDLVEILKVLSDKLQNTHEQSVYHQYELAATTCSILDSMVDSQVEGLSREDLHEPLGGFLSSLKGSSDPCVVFQAAYASQALLNISNDESRTQEILRRSTTIIQGVFGLMSSIKAFDVNDLIGSLKQIQDGIDVSSAIEFAMNTYENVTQLAEDGNSFMECLKQGLSFSEKKTAWYMALRGLDAKLQVGQLTEFEKLVRESPCAKDPAFQWGVCQRLGEIAGNDRWSQETRLCAIEFLKELYVDDETWGRQGNVKLWILRVLHQIETVSSGASSNISKTAQDVMKELGADGDAYKQKLPALFAKKRSKNKYSLQLNSPPKKFPLLDLIQDLPDLETAIRKLRDTRINSKGRGDDEGEAIYIPLKARKDLLSEKEDEFDLMSRVLEFKESNKKVFLLRGSSGSGKSVFNRKLELELWNAYKPGGKIPLFIHLPTIKDVEHKMIEEQLKKAGMNSATIAALKKLRDFFLICDGYDECQLTQNLYVTNELNQTGGWVAQMEISCRTDYSSSDYKVYFDPNDKNVIGDSDNYQEVVVAPFSEEQIKEYVDKFTSKTTSTWSRSNYQEALDDVPNLQNLVKNPFVLRMAMEILPDLFKTDSDLSDAMVTRVDIYDRFMTEWLERSLKRLVTMKLDDRDVRALKELQKTGFKEDGIEYVRDLALQMYTNQPNDPTVKFIRIKDKSNWKMKFFGENNKKETGNHLLRDAVPLVNDGNIYQFIHVSYLEYGLSLSVFNPLTDLEDEEPVSTMNRHKSTSSLRGLNAPPPTQVVESQIDRLLNSPLGTWYLVGNSSTTDCLKFLVDRARTHPLFRNQLHAVIERSKPENSKDTDGDRPRIAAANAITILVKAGVQFNGYDFRGVRIAMADLSYGVFDSTRFDNADLRKVNLRNIWLRGANLNGAKMTGALFGEYPYIYEEDHIESCFYSPDGKRFASALTTSNVKVYDIASWEPISELVGQDEITALEFSPTGTQIAIGCVDYAVRLYDILSGKLEHTLEDHTDKVTSLSYSPSGNHIISGSYDNSIKLWDTKEGKLIHTSGGSGEGFVEDGNSAGAIGNGHVDDITGVIFSPDGNMYASGSYDHTVKLWNAEDGKIIHTFEGHTQCVDKVIFSPSADRIASASSDTTVRIWSVISRELLHTLTIPDMRPNYVLFSPKGDQIAASYNDAGLEDDEDSSESTADGIVVLWDAKSGEPKHTLRGHKRMVSSIMYSPNGDRLVSGGSDKKAFLWDTTAGKKIQVLDGHTHSVDSVIYSPKGDMIASRESNYIRLWEVDTGLSIRTISGHTSEVSSVSVSGDSIASSSKDGSIRIWDYETGGSLRALLGHEGPVECAAYSNDGSVIVSGGSDKDKTVRIWDAKTGQSKILGSHGEKVTCIATSSTGQVASGSLDRTVRLWDTDDSSKVTVLSEHSEGVSSLAYSPNGRNIVSGCTDGLVKLWNTETGSYLRTLDGHSKGISSIKYSPAGDYIATSSLDHSVKIWGATGGAPITLQDHTDVVTSVEFSHDGTMVASCSSDRTVRIYRTADGTPLQVFHNPIELEYDNCVAFSPCGKFVVTGSSNNTFGLWVIESGDYKESMVGGHGKVQSLIMKEENTTSSCMIAGSEDGSVRCWIIEKVNGEYSVSLKWSSSHEVLNVSDTSFKDTAGLTNLQKRLLSQRGSLNVPLDSKI